MSCWAPSGPNDRIRSNLARGRAGGHALGDRRAVGAAAEQPRAGAVRRQRLCLQQSRAHAPEAAGVGRHRGVAVSAPAASGAFQLAADGRGGLCAVARAMAVAGGRGRMAATRGGRAGRLAGMTPGARRGALGDSLDRARTLMAKGFAPVLRV